MQARRREERCKAILEPLPREQADPQARRAQSSAMASGLASRGDSPMPLRSSPRAWETPRCRSRLCPRAWEMFAAAPPLRGTQRACSARSAFPLKGARRVGARGGAAGWGGANEPPQFTLEMRPTTGTPRALRLCQAPPGPMHPRYGSSEGPHPASEPRASPAERAYIPALDLGKIQAGTQQENLGTLGVFT